METIQIKKQKTLVPELRFKEFDKEWVINLIGNTCSVKTGGSDTQDRIDNGKYPFFVRSNTVERINKFSYDGEAILTSGDGVGVGKNFHYINGKFDYHQRVYALIEFKKDYNGKFIFQVFKEKFYKRVIKLSAKNSVDSVRMSMITEMKVAFPSLPEQQKIASFLSAVDEKIQQLTRKKELLEQYKKGVMQQLFSGKLRFKDENGKEYADWELHQIEDLVKRKILDKPLDGNHGSIHPVSSDFVSKGIPFVMANNIRNGKLNLEGVTCIKKEQADKLQKGFSIEGDVLLTHKGSVGLSAIVQKLDTDYIMLTPQVTYYRILESQKLVNTFLKIVFDSSLFQKRLQTLADSGTRPYIGITLQRTLEIPLPSVNEQKKIANFISDIDSKIESTTQQINQTQTFKKGLLQKMFV
jgi:type I restriction enzyme S subunit